MSTRRVFIALKETTEIELLNNFFDLFKYKTIRLTSLDHLDQINLKSDILLVDLYFEETSILQLDKLPREKKYKVFLTTPRSLFEDEEAYALEGKINILKKPIDFSALYSRLLDHMEIQ